MCQCSREFSSGLSHIWDMWPQPIPSGNLLHSYWKWWLRVDWPIENGGSFHSYVSHYQRVPIHSWTDFNAYIYLNPLMLLLSLPFWWWNLPFLLAESLSLPEKHQCLFLRVGERNDVSTPFPWLEPQIWNQQKQHQIDEIITHIQTPPETYVEIMDMWIP